MTNATIESGELRVVFAWRGDRYGHAIQRRMDGDWRTVLESVEGCPDDDWPWLGSAYRSADRPSQPLIQIAAQSPDASCEFVVDQEISVWRIRPAAIAQKYPATIRWRYTVVLDNDATSVL